MSLLSFKRGREIAVSTVASALLLAACGSSTVEESEGTTDDAAGSSDTVTELREYDGPESELPTSFEEPTIQEGFSFTIGYPSPARAVPSLAAQEDGVREEVERLGGEVISTDANFDVQRQVSQFEQLLSQGVDAIVLSALDPGSLGPLLERAEDQGVPVFINDVPHIAGEDLLDGFSASILSGSDLAGYERAKLVAEAQPGARFGVIGVGIPAPMLEYISSQAQYWGEELGLEFVDRVDASVDTIDAGAEAASALLARQPDLDVIITSDVLAVGALTAARQTGRDDISIVGLGGNSVAIDAVKDGGLLATYYVDSRELHKQLVWAAYNELTDQNLPQPPQVLLEGSIITRENADSFEPIG